jgi:hypothetical protein
LIIVEIDTMTSVPLDNSREVASSNIREVHPNLVWDGCRRIPSSEAVRTTVWKIELCISYQQIDQIKGLKYTNLQ